MVGIFPNEASIVRLIGAVLIEANDEWSLQHRYLGLEPLNGLASGADDAPSLLAPPAEPVHLPPAAA
ncbi:transposase [Methylobacterium sp. 4-46]|uniref:transposase n=1 Tax=unclassified Methylobacterium TaxID=2615210 RepID=UPI0002ED8722